MPESWCLDCMAKLRSVAADIEKFRRCAAYWNRYLSERQIDDGDAKTTTSAASLSVECEIVVADVVATADDTFAEFIDDATATITEHVEQADGSFPDNNAASPSPANFEREDISAAIVSTPCKKKTSIVVRQEKYECHYCGLRTPFKRRMVGHFRRIHGLCKPECSECNRSFRGP